VSRRNSSSSSASSSVPHGGLLSPTGEHRQTLVGTEFSISSDQSFVSVSSPTLLPSPQDFRARTSSNGSSICGHGRLSPIQAEPDIDANMLMDAEETSYYPKPCDALTGVFRVGNSSKFQESPSTTLNENGTQMICSNRSYARLDGSSETGYVQGLTVDQYQLNQFHSNSLNSINGVPNILLTDNLNKTKGDYSDTFSLKSAGSTNLPGQLIQQSKMQQQLGTPSQQSCLLQSQSEILRQQLGMQQSSSEQSRMQQAVSQLSGIKYLGAQQSDMEQSGAQQRHMGLKRLLGEPQQQQPLNLFRDRQAFLQLMADRPHLKVKVQQLLAQRYQQRDAQLLQELQKQQQQLQQSQTLLNGQQAVMENNGLRQMDTELMMNKIDSSVLKQLLTGDRMPQTVSAPNGVSVKTEDDRNTTADGDISWGVNSDVGYGSVGGEPSSSTNNTLPFDFDVDFRPSSDIECDINQVINYDSLYLDDPFDFALLNVDASMSDQESDNFADICN